MASPKPSNPNVRTRLPKDAKWCNQAAYSLSTRLGSFDHNEDRTVRRRNTAEVLGPRSRAPSLKQEVPSLIDATAWKSRGAGPPIVLDVNPADDLGHDPEHSAHIPVYGCSSAKVRLVDRNPHITEEQAEAGWEKITDE